MKYDRLLLETAESAAARNSGQLSLADVAAIWDDASDGASDGHKGVELRFRIPLVLATARRANQLARVQCQ